MSESQVPAYVDTRKIFQQQGKISGQVALHRLPRFREYLASDEAVITVELDFSSNESGQQLISGKLAAQVQVNCQRCLEPIAIELADDIRLVLFRQESQAENLNPELDPWIWSDFKLELAPLVEEQLILCLPIVSSHAAGTCIAKLNYAPLATGEAQHEEEPAANPFSILKSLKENDETAS